MCGTMSQSHYTYHHHCCVHKQCKCSSWNPTRTLGIDYNWIPIGTSFFLYFIYDLPRALLPLFSLIAKLIPVSLSFSRTPYQPSSLLRCTCTFQHPASATGRRDINRQRHLQKFLLFVDFVRLRAFGAVSQSVSLAPFSLSSHSSPRLLAVYSDTYLPVSVSFCPTVCLLVRREGTHTIAGAERVQ